MNDITRITNRSHRSHTRDRRGARVRISLVLACALGVLLAWVGVWHEILPWNSASDGVAVAKLPINEENPSGGDYCRKTAPDQRQPAAVVFILQPLPDFGDNVHRQYRLDMCDNIL